MRIKNDIICDGLFWLPENEDKKIPGTIFIKENEKIYLELKGIFKEELGDSSESEFGVIFGYVEKLNSITLSNSFYINTNLNFGGYGTSSAKLLVNQVYSGAFLASPDECLFDSITFSCDHLDDWIGISGIDVKRAKGDEPHAIYYKVPENILIKLGDRINLSVIFSYGMSGFKSITEAKFTQNTYLKLNSEVPLKISEFESLAYKIVKFISLGVGCPLVLSELTGKLSDNTVGESVSFYPESNQIKIFYQSAVYCDKKNILLNEMNFNFDRVHCDISAYINSWINIYDRLKPAVELYFSSFSGRSPLVEARFLSLAQGLETFHRRISDEKYIDEEKFHELVGDILKHCPEEHIKWLDGRLKHGNEINLNTRLLRLVSQFGSIVGDEKTINKLTRKITTTRNYKTHYSDSNEKAALSGIKLYKMVIFMECLFMLLFFKEIGFNNELIEKICSMRNGLLSRNLKYALSE
ncbi:HEPN domain-containing protein [Serratia marcescens]|uniref:ApeA N-terminal domain 1-containing protein n=1 Tax=Serratia marcescens TaxID=615 RepID=UPI0038357681